MTPVFQCDNCSRTLTADEIIPLEEVRNLLCRISPGETVPAGECTRCGALAFPVHQEPEPSGKTRMIEVYYGFEVGNAKSWDTDYVEIPAETPEGQIEEAATQAFLKRAEQWRDVSVAFCGVYNSSDEETP